MIGQLTGAVASEDADGSLVLDVGGVGYELLAPPGMLGRARANASSERLTLFIHTHVREDALLLYAFATPGDKAVFRMLIGVSNVGPKMALALLSAMPGDELAGVVAAKDLARLVAVPGIGKKTAERLLLELKDKLVPTPPAPAGEARHGPRRTAPPPNPEHPSRAATRP